MTRSKLRKIASYLGLVIATLTLVTTIWAYSAEFTRMDSRIESKASKTSVQRMDGKLDLIICYLDKTKCL